MFEPNQHIWLCGFMGCGKSTVGPLLSTLCGMSFIDMDLAIEEGEGMQIPAIFSQYGETYFRELETAYVAKLSKLPASVIAAGGGTFLSAVNTAKAKISGSIVFLDVPFEICYARIVKSDRPIVRQNTKDSLREIYDRRRPLYYHHADLCFEASLSPTETAQDIAQRLEISVFPRS